MNPPVTTQLAHADPNAAPLTINELIDIFNPLFSSIIQGSYVPYVMQQATPSVEDQDKAWIELDSAGRPLSIRTFYNGNWRRVYNGMVGEVRGYTGNPGDTSVWDANGHGVIGGLYDGWQICNGKNGSPDLSDKFFVGAHMNNASGHSGYNGTAWQTFVDGATDQVSGGSKDHMVVASELPPWDPINGTSKAVLHGHEYKSDADHTPDFAPLIDVHYANLIAHDWTIGHYGAGPNDVPPVPQTAIPTIPPFYAVAFIIFQGY